MERKLAAILAADVVGYTRLMGGDEAGTLRRLTVLREQVLEPLIAKHRGRVVKLMGDGLLVEFASVVDAVDCALDWQEQVSRREAENDEKNHLIFRIGINLGDVIVEGDDLYGDGVNIASRLESHAVPGGICLSSDAYRQAKGKVEVDFEDLGEHDLKNVAEPMRIYQIAGGNSGTDPTQRRQAPLPLPDKPSIAVLPLANVTGDKEQEYFSDGVTDDIITELSRFGELFVIARSSSFSYKGRAVKVQEIATDLGVRYVLDGSVRAAGDRIRISAQLIDAETGHHIWSERYNREITDLFALQDEIAKTVAATVAGRLRISSENRAARKPIQNLAAYDFALRGQSINADTKGDNLRAIQAFEKAIELDPNCTKAYVGLALNYVIGWFSSWLDPAEHPLDRALEYAAMAVSLENTDSKAQMMLGHVHMNRREFEDAEVHLQRALELNSNDAEAFAYMGIQLDATGKPAEAIDCYHKAMRLNPYYPAWYLWKLGDAHYAMRHYKEALTPLREAVSRNPKLKRARLGLAASYAQLDRIEEARKEMAELLAHHPDATIKHEELWEFANADVKERRLEGLRKAGLPE